MPAKRTMRFLAARSGTSLLCAARSWALVGFQGVGNVRFIGRSPWRGCHLPSHFQYDFQFDRRTERKARDADDAARLTQTLEGWHRLAFVALLVANAGLKSA